MGKKYLSVDMRTQDLLMEEWSPIQDIFNEMKMQWDHARIGTTYSYFDQENRLHLHFMERGGYLERKGALDQVPRGNLPGYAIHPVFNEVGSKAEQTGNLLVQMDGVDANDPRWDHISELLTAMEKEI